ncbi:MAG TPA: sulfur oxidation c-type cytochrome SoxA [Burkholderiales bacterium]|nr:sulfur oxidation c-type cytochrome SoxA [Burkholderiales bacterium]
MVQILRQPTVHAFIGATLCGVLAGIVLADDAMEEINKYRDMLKDDNPAELIAMQGEDLWKTPRGPRNATLQNCDLGLGPGVVKGAYARLPRYFADTGKVQDLESRLVTCMVQLQGLTREEAVKGWYEPGSALESLLTYVAAQSKGEKIDVPAAHPKEAALYSIGEAFFWHRSGPLDFGCSTCHSHDNRRIRLQEVPNLTTAQGAREAVAQWPAYRVSQGAVWGMERRLLDCIRQMRYPEADFLSDAIVALEVYMQKNASGAVLDVPGIKR